MIKENELRVGSTYLLPSGYNRLPSGEVTLSAQEMAFIFDIGCFDEIEPIPLTNELLDKIGLKKEVKDGEFFIEVKYILEDKTWLKTEQWKKDGSWDKGYAFYRGDGDFVSEVYFLHELQNVFYIVKKKELLINSITKQGE